MSGIESEPNLYPVGRFSRLVGGGNREEIEVSRPLGMYYPVGVSLKWLSPGAGREILNKVLSELVVLEVSHLVRAFLDGEIFYLDALEEMGNRPASTLETWLADQPDTYRLIHNGDELVEGARLDLLLSFELLLRCALRPFKEIADPPNWVKRARKVYPELTSALTGEALFE
ncbi:MAG: hypothetical protein WCS37_15850 [Chloroflexota bacterium]|nr:hypothetical protein [Chloroflexota bacterium]